MDFIFLPGFSTVEKVTDLSGRGVGMDVVRSNLKRMNGTIELDSHLGKGTTVRLRLPLTLAILPVLLVEVSEEIYALPLRAVLETVRIQSGKIHRVEGSEVLQLRGDTLPLLRLRELFGLPAGGSESGQKVVILGIGGHRVALLVDKFIGQESTVMKPLGAYLHGSAQLAGATISGDGRVRLVLDPAGLLAAAPQVQPCPQEREHEFESVRRRGPDAGPPDPHLFRIRDLVYQAAGIFSPTTSCACSKIAVAAACRS